MSSVDLNVHGKHAPPPVLSVLRRSLFLLTIADGTLLFLLPIYAEHLGASGLEIGSLVAIYFLCPMLLRPWMGKRIDTFGRKSLAIYGSLMYVAAMVLFLFAHTLLLLFIARVVEGLSAVLLRLVALAVVADVTEPASRSGSFGSLESAIAWGAFLGAVWAFVVLAFTGIDTGWSIMFVSYTLFAIVGAGLLARRLPETRKPVQQLPHLVRRAIISRPLLVLLPVVLLTSLSAGMVTPILLIYMQAHFTVNLVALGLAYIPAALALGYFPTWAGQLNDLIGQKRPMAVATLVAAGVTLCMPFAPALWIVVILWVIEALCASTTVPAQESLVARMGGDDRQGRNFALYGTAAAIGTAIGPVLGGWLYDTYSHAMPFIIDSGLTVVAALLIIAFVRDETGWRLPLMQAIRVLAGRMLSPKPTAAGELPTHIPRLLAIGVAILVTAIVVFADIALLLLLVWLGSGKDAAIMSISLVELPLWAAGAVLFGAAHDILPGHLFSMKAALIGLGMGLVEEIAIVPQILATLRQLSPVFAGGQGQIIAYVVVPLEAVVVWALIGYIFGLIIGRLASSTSQKPAAGVSRGEMNESG
jgi:MFS family permease